MSGLDWEKQNRKEQLLEPADPGHIKAISKHVKQREAAKRHRERTFIRGIEKGIAQERLRITELLRELDRPNKRACSHAPKGVNECCGVCQTFLDPAETIALIRGQIQ
jgi:hypothetical protein